ncbi:MAG: flagellar biosynthesis protein FlhB [Bacillota bacterium]
MAWGDQQQKTEPATPRRIQEARRKGQVARSHELNGAMLLLAVVLLFFLLREHFVLAMEQMVAELVRAAGTFQVDARSVGRLAVAGAVFTLRVLGPVFGLALAVAVLVNLAQVGFLFAPSVLQPKLERISVVKGLERIFSVRGLVELLKALFKVVVIGGLLAWLIHVRLPELLVLVEATPGAGLYVVGNAVLAVLLAAGAVYLGLAGADYLYQRHTYRQQLMMTRTELKEELRHTEGDPLVKSWLRRKQRQISLNRIRQEVPRATVVVTNPAHVAVALRYEEGKTNAPVVTAKGANYLAQRIRELAEQHNVPVVENPPVARALYRSVEVGREIPVALYQAVAEILALVYRLKRSTAEGRA